VERAVANQEELFQFQVVDETMLTFGIEMTVMESKDGNLTWLNPRSSL
jgi:hypothetical protein